MGAVSVKFRKFLRRIHVYSQSAQDTTEVGRTPVAG